MRVCHACAVPTKERKPHGVPRPPCTSRWSPLQGRGVGGGDEDPSPPTSHRGLSQPREESGKGGWGGPGGSFPEEATEGWMDWGFQPGDFTEDA